MSQRLTKLQVTSYKLELEEVNKRALDELMNGHLMTMTSR
jgi:hypothetical protein